MRCPCCGGDTDRGFQKEGYRIWTCPACGHGFTQVDTDLDHVRTTYSDTYFFGGGPGYHDYLSEGDLLRDHGRRYGQLLRRHHVRSGPVLDVGAAAGFVLQGFREAGWTGQGVEPNPGMAAHARSALGLPVVTGTLEDLPRTDRFTVVSMIQVVAHLYDLPRAFAVAAEITESDGWWLIETWNRRSLTARLFGAHWHEYSPPSVLHWFTPRSLARLAGQFGFSEVARGRPQKWLNAGHAKSLLRFKLPGRAVGRVVDTVGRLLPDATRLPYPSEDLFWMLLRRRPTS